MHGAIKWLRRNALRLVALVAFSILALGIVPHPLASSLLPRLSPILGLLGPAAARAWIGWAMLLGVPLLALAFLKGRVFCWRFCPMGFLAELAGLLNPWGGRAVHRVPVLNTAILAVIAVSAAFGYPLFIWLDPLCIFNGFFAAWRAPLAAATLATAICFAAVIAVSIAVPNIWCHRLCPLGGLQELVRYLALRLRAALIGRISPPPSPNLPRRALIATIPAALAGFAAQRVFGANSRKALRPPGADLERINALCARCGNCMRACPYQLIQPDLGDSGIDGLLTPVIWFRGRNPEQEQDCFQDCVKCTQVCPTGALRPISAEQKRKRAIGIAEIDQKKCIAWANSEYCAVCDEYCPYKAIKLTKRGEVMCPTVDETKCRGCGACESACAADPVAITVKPLR